MSEQLDVRPIMETMTRRTQDFQVEELGIEVVKRGDAVDHAHKIKLKHLTSIMGLEGHIGVFLAFSFDEALIQKALDAFSDDIEIDEEERDLYMEEAASEILNTIVGNATADMDTTAQPIRLSPPIIVSEARSVLRHRGAQFYSVLLQTSDGELNIHCIGPKALFDEQLHYIPEET